MPQWILSFWGLLAQMVGTLVGRVLVSLGMAYLSFLGLDTVVSEAKDALLSAIGGQGGVVVQLASVLQIGTCVNIICSTALAKLGLSGLTNGTLTKLLFK